jgi:hypothetical protein
MPEKNVVEFIEEWQMGVLFVLAAILGGVVVSTAIGLPESGLLGPVGFFTGAILTFLLFSYLRYGR